MQSIKANKQTRTIQFGFVFPPLGLRPPHSSEDKSKDFSRIKINIKPAFIVTSMSEQDLPNTNCSWIFYFLVRFMFVWKFLRRPRKFKWSWTAQRKSTSLCSLTWWRRRVGLWSMGSFRKKPLRAEESLVQLCQQAPHTECQLAWVQVRQAHVTTHSQAQRNLRQTRVLQTGDRPDDGGHSFNTRTVSAAIYARN